jgi:hypothetical protein
MARNERVLTIGLITLYVFKTTMEKDYIHRLLDYKIIGNDMLLLL